MVLKGWLGFGVGLGLNSGVTETRLRWSARGQVEYNDFKGMNGTENKMWDDGAFH